MSHEVTTFIRAFIWLPPESQGDFTEETYVYNLSTAIEFLKLKEAVLKKYPEAEVKATYLETTPYQTALMLMRIKDD
jgi:hypothetical protein|tara:strand:+ start:56771 stop:57001 length:231 start_codon:yes stop_codon:yes gene_type:complete